jgi:hypothetical protein
MGIRKDLLVTEEIAESSDLRPTPFEFESELLSCHTAASCELREIQGRGLAHC